MATAKKATKTKAQASAVAARLLRATAALRRDYAAAKAKLAKLGSQEKVAFDAYWEIVGTMIEGERPLYQGGGYTTLKAFVTADLPGENVRSVRRNVLVARCFTPQDEARHGINFLEEVALFAQAQAGAAEPPRAIDLDRLRVPVRTKDGDHRTKPAREATIAEVRAARKGATRGSTRKRVSPTEAAVRAALAKTVALRGVSVRLVDGKLSLGAIPVDALGALTKALAKLKLPAEG